MTNWRWALLALTFAALACGGSGGDAPPDGNVDADGDGHPVSTDCDDHDASVWQLLPGHRDVDRDLHGAGAQEQVCSGESLPYGYVADGTDCDDGDMTAWQRASGFFDADGDGYGSGEEVSLCVGASVTPGYAAQGGDCAPYDAGAHQLVPLNADADHDGVGAGPQVMVCAGDEVPYGYSDVTGDCDPADATRWQELAYAYRDADGDGAYVASAGMVCSGHDLPVGYLLSPNMTSDCDDGDPRRYVNQQFYADVDGDGVGAGAQVTVCTDWSTRPPAGYSASWWDCAPDDGRAWQNTGYDYRDADGDGATVKEKGSLCTDGTLPAGYSAAPGPKGVDCDDNRGDLWAQLTGYADADGDGVGAGPGAYFCTNGTLPTGYVATATDCAPDDASAWRSYAYTYRDGDGDGAWASQSGTLCIGATVPAGYATSYSGELDCDDTNPAISRTVSGYADADGDGVGAGARVYSCTDGRLPAGQVPTSSPSNDCAPDDPSKWQLLAAAGTDEDRDGHSTRVASSVCSGKTLPFPYVATATGNDCNDQNATLWRWVVLYPDHDGDGIGAPPRTIPCLGADLPAGYSLYGWDPDDDDRTVTTAPEDEPLAP